MIFIALSGHRDSHTFISALDEIFNSNPDAIWVHGGAEGFDTQVEKYCQKNNIRTIIIKPDYRKWKTRPKYAPIARNKEIVDMCSCLYVCYDGRKTGGTKSTIDYANATNKPIYILPSVPFCA